LKRRLVYVFMGELYTVTFLEATVPRSVWDGKVLRFDLSTSKISVKSQEKCCHKKFLNWKEFVAINMFVDTYLNV